MTLVLATATACGFEDVARNDKIIGAVKVATGNHPELQYSVTSWCSDTVDGARAAMVAAVGPVQAIGSAGAGGYFVEVLADGTVGPAVKASPPDGSASSEALRIDRKYCQGKFVAGPQAAFDQLQEMSDRRQR